MRKIFFLIYACLLIISQTYGQVLQDTIPTGLTTECEDVALRYITPGAPALNSAIISNPLPKADLSKYLPFIENQGFKASCTAFSVAAALTILDNKSKNNQFATYNRSRDDKYFSPAFIFNVAKSKYPPPRNSECDLGISYIDAFLVVENFGVVSWAKYPYDIINNNQCTNTVPDDLVKNAKANKILTFQRPTRTRGVFKALICDKNLEYPINISVYLDENYKTAWRNNSGSDAGRWRSKGAPLFQQTQHAMCVVGYDDEKKAFKVLDSRGVSWGDKGYIWIDYSIIEDPTVVYDAYVCSFDNKILRQMDNQGSAETDNANFSSNPENSLNNNNSLDTTTWVKAGYYRNIGSFRIACADINKRDQTGQILIRDSVGNPLTPITMVSVGEKPDDHVTFDLGYNKIDLYISGIGTVNRISLAKPAIFFRAVLR